jgi:hypothetical protein
MHELMILAHEPWRAWAIGKKCQIVLDENKALDNIDCVTSAKPEHEDVYLAIMNPITMTEILQMLKAHNIVSDEREMAQLLAFYAVVKKAARR